MDCGDTSLVLRLSTSVTELAWHGELPRLIPNLALGFHFGILPFACNVLFKA